MQLLAIALYNADGECRVVDFRPGELNIVTGVSKTGKSALLDIVDFCLGRSTITTPVGPITDTVQWYGVLLQMPNGRAFVGRPAGRKGAASTQRAMLELGAELELPDAKSLEVNADTGAVRDQLGRLIGIDENRRAAPAWAEQGGLEASLGHAVLLCLQGQGEVANRTHLFHRQGDEGIPRVLRDTLPYFLGAVPADQALKRQQLTTAQRDLRIAEGQLRGAERLNDEVEVGLRAVLTEARAKGLVNAADVQGRAEVIEVLRAALDSATSEPTLDDEQLARRQQLEQRRSELRRSLRGAADQRGLLDEQGGTEEEYTTVVNSQIARLQSLHLCAPTNGADSECPVCGSQLSQPDATVSDLRAAAEELAVQLADVDTTRPRRESLLRELDARTEELRRELRAVEGALAGLLASADVAEGATRAEEQAFTKGRIDQYLESITVTEDAAMARLREAVANARSRVAKLEAELDPAREQDELTSRLGVVSNDMTRLANELALEHTDGVVRLDLSRLTIVTDTDSGPAPLMRIGSGENWVGYHLAAHLALHRFFVRHDRPVPRILMLDQPTQVFYPSDVEIREGVPAGEETRETVRRLYEVMRDVITELGHHMQLIVCDHANLPEDWFQASVRHNWRDGRKLIPDSWIERAGEQT
jgi:hypothetical protein